EARVVRLRLEIGPRDVAAGQAMLARRTGGKASAPRADLRETIAQVLEEIQAALLSAARERREAHSIRGATKERFLEFMQNGGGFAYGGFCGQGTCEAEIKDATSAT